MFNKVLICFFLSVNFLYAQLYPLIYSNDIDGNSSIDLEVDLISPPQPWQQGQGGYKIRTFNNYKLNPFKLNTGTPTSGLTYNSDSVFYGFIIDNIFLAFKDIVNQRYGWVYFELNGTSIKLKYYYISEFPIYIGQGLQDSLEASKIGMKIKFNTLYFPDSINYYKGFLVKQNENPTLASLDTFSNFTIFNSIGTYDINYNFDSHNNFVKFDSLYNYYVIAYPKDSSHDTLKAIVPFLGLDCYSYYNPTLTYKYIKDSTYQVEVSCNTPFYEGDTIFVEIPNSLNKFIITDSTNKITFLTSGLNYLDGTPIHSLNGSDSLILKIIAKPIHCSQSIYNKTLVLARNCKFPTLSVFRNLNYNDERQLNCNINFQNQLNLGISKIWVAWSKSIDNITISNIDTTKMINIIFQNNITIRAEILQKDINGNVLIEGLNYNLVVYCTSDTIYADNSTLTFSSPIQYYIEPRIYLDSVFYAGVIGQNCIYTTSKDIDNDGIYDYNYGKTGSGHAIVVQNTYFSSSTLEIDSSRGMNYIFNEPFYKNDNYFIPNTLHVSSFTIDYTNNTTTGWDIGFGPYIPFRKLRGNIYDFGWIELDKGACICSKFPVTIDNTIKNNIFYWNYESQTINFLQKCENLEILNLMGQSVYTNSNPINEIKVENIIPNFYILKITYKNQCFFQKIAVQN